MHTDFKGAAVPRKWGAPRPTIEQLRRLPAKLREKQAFVVWRLVWEDGNPKPKKQPFYVNGKPRSGRQGGAEDRESLGMFEEALAALETGRFDGIGFATLPEFGITAIDCDACVIDGVIAPDVANLVLGTYSEISPSGNGIRAFFGGALPDLKDCNPPEWDFKLEVSHSTGYVTVTGAVNDDCLTFGCEDVVAEITPEVLRECDERRQRQANLAHMQRVGNDDDDTSDSSAWAASAGVTDQTLDDLRSALHFLASKGHGDEYDAWHAIGQALKSLGEKGRDLWLDFSSRCDKFDAKGAVKKWERDLKGERTGYASIFKRAQNLGWINPAKSRASVSEVNFEDLTDKTDTGNANRLLQLTVGDLRYVPEREVWMFWNGHAWIVDLDRSLAFSQALLVSRHYMEKAAEFERQTSDASLSDAERKKLAALAKTARSWATACRNKGKLDAMLALLSVDPRAIVHADQLDTHPHLLGVANGVVDLRTGELRPAARDDFVTKRSRYAYHPDASADRWRQFVNEATGLPLPVEVDADGGIQADSVGRYRPREQYASYLQRAGGYWATGEDREHKFFIATGGGANGKSVIFDTMQDVCGDYATVIVPEALSVGRNDTDAERPSSAIAALAGRRFVVSSESRDGQRLDGTLIKRHTGGGYIAARFMRENVFRFRITHKIVLMTNHRPALDLLDEATRGRVHLLPFDRTWNRPGKTDRDPRLPDGDKNLMQVLAGEAEGVLAWIVEGAVAYYRDGLNPPPEVIGATVDFFQEADALGRWLATLERCEPKSGKRVSDAFNEFNSWCLYTRTPAGVRSVKSFSAEIDRRGIGRVKLETGAHIGIKSFSEFSEFLS